MRPGRVIAFPFWYLRGHVTLATSAAAKSLLPAKNCAINRACTLKDYSFSGSFAACPRLPWCSRPRRQQRFGPEKRWTDAYKLRNITLMTSMLADDFIMTVEDGSIYGKMGYMAHTADTSTEVDVADESDFDGAYARNRWP